MAVLDRSSRRAARRRLSRRWQTAALALLLSALLICWRWPQPFRPSGPQTLHEGTHRLERVIDGDTLLLANGARVRLIGVDTPETVRPNHPPQPWGLEAARLTRRLVSGGEVRLEFDGPRKDRYGRFLAHVWVGNRMLAEELVRAGLATAETRYDYAYDVKVRLLEAQAEARAARLGIWSDIEGFR